MIEFRVLGSFEVVEGDRSLALGSPRQRALLAVLLVHRGEPVSTERLIDELWGEQAPASAIKIVQGYVSNLRKVLGDGLLVTHGHGYLLTTTPDQTDLDHFESLVVDARRALQEGDARSGAARLREALGLWRGPPLADFAYESFAQPEIARLDERRLAVLEERIDAELALDNPAALVGELAALVREHPLRERVRGQLMLALYRAGRQADALAVYRQTSELLRDQLGLEPSRALRELERSILSHHGSLEPGPSLRASRVGNLPSWATSFVGRARELAEVSALVNAPHTRLLTLTGAGGSGKTRLALRVVDECAQRYRDGAWFASLADISDPELVGARICVSLGLADQADLTAMERLEEWLRPRTLILVLDNLEQFAGATEWVSALVAGCPGLTLVATSREPLHLAAEYQYETPVMAPADAIDLLIERAGLVTRRLAGEPARMHQICERLDYLPLAIELAAARTKMLSLDDVLTRLEHRMDLLVGGPRDAPQRQRTLQAALDWSYELLAHDEQRLLAWLAVFAGGFTLAVAEQVAALNDPGVTTLASLTSLVDKSLIVAEPRGDAVRYRLLETVREYAFGRLIEYGEVAAARDRHRDAFVALAEMVAPRLIGADRHTQGEALERLEPEASNLAAAIDHAAETDGQLALRLCVALTRWWRLRGNLLAGERGFETALAAADPAPSPVRALALFGRSYLRIYAGRLAQADAGWQEALDAAEAVGDPGVLGLIQAGVGFGQVFRDPVASRWYSQQARRHAQAGGNAYALIFAGLNLAYSHLLCAEFDAGERHLHEVAPLTETGGYNESNAWYWVGMAFRPLFAGNADHFYELQSRGHAASSDVGEPMAEAVGQALAGLLDVASGRAEEALERLVPARERAIAAGAGLVLPWIDVHLALAHGAAGDVPGARAMLERVISRTAGFGWILGLAHCYLGDLALNAGDLAAADAHGRSALTIGERVDTPILTAPARELLGRSAAQGSAWERSAELLTQAFATRITHGLWLHVPQTLDALAETTAGLGRREDAAALLGIAHGARADLGLACWTPARAHAAQFERSLREALGDDVFDRAGQRDIRAPLVDAVTRIGVRKSSEGSDAANVSQTRHPVDT